MAPEVAARRLLKSLDVTSPPVDPREVAESLGITVEEANLGQDCSGILVRGSTGAVIGVEISHPELRQRFSVAHELGHFLLHDGSYIDKAISVRYRNLESGSGSKKEEREANLFAASLLMPRPWVLSAAKDCLFDLGDDEELMRLAGTFNVSTQAMSYRLMNLGLLEPS